MVFDVDGHVIAAEDLLARVERLIRTIDDTNPAPSNAVPDSNARELLPEVVAPMRSMQAVLAELHPPDLGRPRGARGRASSSVKRLIRRLTSWYVEPRWILQENYDGRNLELASGIVNAFPRIDAELDELRRQNIRLKLQVVTSVERLNRYRREVDNFLKSVATQEDVHILGRELKRLGAVGSTGTEIDYVAFEDRCRGSSEDLRESQKRYLTLFPPPEGSGQIIDIGCGRGEMLELLIGAGYDVQGVDTDPGMVDVCRSKGLPVVQDDGIHFLEQTDDETLRGIFCAQVVEHLLTSELERLIKLAYRKLLTGGVLVVETINPRSLYALGNHFFADTSHVRPVHPETLSFICEQIGFSRVQLEERSPHPLMAVVDDLPEGELGAAVGTLLKNVFGYQDYAVVATK